MRLFSVVLVTVLSFGLNAPTESVEELLTRAPLPDAGVPTR